VTDDEIIDAYKMLAAKEGVFAEPASAASVAGLIKMVEGGFFKTSPEKKTRIVCILTGHGLKDPDRAISTLSRPRSVKAEMRAVLNAIGL
jgi:threonine synthase